MNNRKIIEIEKNEQIEIKTPYGTLIISAIEHSVTGNNECIGINTIFKSMYIQPIASNDLIIKIDKR